MPDCLSDMLRLRAEFLPQQTHDLLDGFKRELAFRETQNRPTCECRLEEFLDAGQKALCPVVPILNPDPSLTLDLMPNRNACKSDSNATRPRQALYAHERNNLSVHEGQNQL